jgi:hypothetical protein
MNSLFLHARNRQNIQQTLLGLILVLSLMIGSSLPVAQAQEGGAPELFSDAGNADMALDSPAYVVRSRLVNVNFGVLFAQNGQALDASAHPEVTLNLFPDAIFTGVVERVEENFSGGRTWTGSLKGREGYFYLVSSENSFIAHVASQGGIYEVSQTGESLYKVEQIDQSRLGEDAPGLVDHPDSVLLDPNLDTAADARNPIDVMIIFTDDALAAEGSLAAMRARIDLAMAETKNAYIFAGVTTRLRLVFAGLVTYNESGNLDVDLARFRNPSDGIMDNIHTLRNTYGADLVALVVENGGGFCGLASDIYANAATAFQVTVRGGCMTGYYSFGHEFGHLQGARHDLYVDNTSTPYAFGHGHVNTNQRWRTVMAYNNKCADTSPFTYCDRLQFFSNPTKTYSGAPTGQAGSSENYKVLNTTALTVANFRQAKIGKNFNSSFNTSSAPWKPVNGNWVLGSSPSAAYISSAGVLNSYASIQYPSTYGELSFQARVLRKEHAECVVGGVDLCWSGLFIRGNPANLAGQKWWLPSYEFNYTNDGYFRVFKNLANGNSLAFNNWTATAAINQGGWNTLKVVAVGSNLKFYINNTLVFSTNDPSFRTGRMGVQFYTAPSTVGIAGNRLYIDSAKGSNIPTGGVVYDELSDSFGLTVESGPRHRSP